MTLASGQARARCVTALRAHGATTYRFLKRREGDVVNDGLIASYYWARVPAGARSSVRGGLFHAATTAERDFDLYGASCCHLCAATDARAEFPGRIPDAASE